MSGAIYNEIDPYAAEWLERLIERGQIAPGRVERRSVADLKSSDVAGPGQRHFFAGIGGWSLGLRLAGVPDDADVWTGSCPCQGLSDAGKRLAERDPRHLWPAWFDLIRECLPAIVVGEQVASKLGLGWLDLVRRDMERCGYAFGASDLCAASVGAPHIRQRLYFVAVADRQRCEGLGLQLRGGRPRSRLPETGGGEPSSWATPAAHEAGGTPEQFLMRKRRARDKGANLGVSITSLAIQATLAVPAKATTAPIPDATGPTSTTAESEPPVESQARVSDAIAGTPRSGTTNSLVNATGVRARTSWPTPLQRDARGPTRGRRAQGSIQLGQTAQLAAPWATPISRDWKAETAETAEKADHVSRQALLVSGETSSGSPAPTAKRGQLNPDLSRWLMGYPVDWLFAAPSNRPSPHTKKRTGTTAAARSLDSGTPSSPRSPRRSSKRRSPRSGTSK